MMKQFTLFFLALADANKIIDAPIRKVQSKKALQADTNRYQDAWPTLNGFNHVV